VEITVQEAAEHRKTLRRIRESLAGAAGEQSLSQSRTELDAELERYSKSAAALLRSRVSEIRAILEILAQAAQAMTTHSDGYSARFRAFAQELEGVAQMSSLAEIRRRLAGSVTGIRSCVESMQREGAGSVARLKSELRLFQQRVEEAESLAATDSLTGLANRRRAEQLMQRRIDAGQPFSILLFDLDDFKVANDSHGHQIGDYLLQAFAKRLLGQFRAGDVACRWGGDEFLVVLDSLLPDAAGRSREVAERMGGLYAVKTLNGPINIRVSASVGFAHHEPGESWQDLFTKADASLYRRKASQPNRDLRLDDVCTAGLPKA
jgi:diguanylate cyclase (GGDEF)-like protein